MTSGGDITRKGLVAGCWDAVMSSLAGCLVGASVWLSMTVASMRRK